MVRLVHPASEAKDYEGGHDRNDHFDDKELNVFLVIIRGCI